MTKGAILHRHDFASREELAGALARELALHLQNVTASGYAALAVSGGTTPCTLFDRLSHSKLDWRRIYVTLVDERWVPETSEHSNARLVKENLLRNAAGEAHFMPLYNGRAMSWEAIREKAEELGIDIFSLAHAQACSDSDTIDQAVKEVPRPFAAVVLGMGADGHTASFFPSRPIRGLNALDTARTTIEIAPGDSAPEKIRITWIFPELISTRFLALHIEGEEKRRVLEQALEPGPVEDMPVRAVLRQERVPVNVFWAP